MSFLPASANGRHQINTFLEESKAFLRVAPPGPSSPRHGGLWLQPSSQFCSPIPSSSGSQTPPAPVGLPASGHMSSLCRDVTDGNGGVRSDMPGGEEKNLGWRKYRQKHSFALFFFFPRHFYSPRASRFLPSSKASKKTSNKHDSSARRYTDSASSPSKTETSGLNLQEKFIPLKGT